MFSSWLAGSARNSAVEVPYAAAGGDVQGRSDRRSRDALSRLAEALLAAETLDGDAVKAIVSAPPLVAVERPPSTKACA